MPLSRSRLTAHALRHVPADAMVRAQGPWLAWVLACALVLAPLLGQMHRLVHLGGQTSAASHAAQASPSASRWVHALFDGHGPAGCQLLDQHHHGLAGPSAIPSLAALWLSQVLAWPRYAARDGRIQAAFFYARAPPALITLLMA